jgi:DNA polymerase-3 subunit epsilon
VSSKDRHLVLSRPLVVFDLETTGLDVRSDRIVEVSCVKIGVDGSHEIRTRRINPGMPISPQATAVHGITDEDVRDEPSFGQLARSLFALLEGCDLSGFNIEGFDLPMLTSEFERVGIRFPAGPTHVVDSWRIFLQKEPRDLTAAYRFYCGRDLAAAHSAEADAKAAAEVLLAQVARYADLPTAVDGLHDFCHPVHPEWIDGDGKLVFSANEACLAFGKHRYKTLRRMVQEESDYLHWILQSDFSDEVKDIVREALSGRFPVPPEGEAH